MARGLVQAMSLGEGERAKRVWHCPGCVMTALLQPAKPACLPAVLLACRPACPPGPATYLLPVWNHWYSCCCCRCCWRVGAAACSQFCSRRHVP